MHRRWFSFLEVDPNIAKNFFEKFPTNKQIRIPEIRHSYGKGCGTVRTYMFASARSLLGMIIRPEHNMYLPMLYLLLNYY